MSCAPSNAVQRTASGIATAIWSPEELYALDNKVDVLRPALNPVAVDNRRLNNFRLSLLLAPFEVLQDFWAPHAVEPVLLKDDGSVGIHCAEMRWDGRPDASTTGTIVEQCRAGSWFRVATTLSQRTFVVDRSAAHVQTLVAALRYSFPHLLVPAENEPSQPMCTVLMQFIGQHWSALSAYLPLLYFLFEMQERCFCAFYKQVSLLLQARKANDAAASDALKPKKSGKLFSWFSSKPKEAELGVNEKLEVVNTHKAALPPQFEKRYMLALAKQEQLCKMQLFCRDYVSALRADVAVFQALAEGLAASPMGTEAVAGWYSPEAADQAAKANATVKQMNTSVQRFAFRKSSLANELLLPLLKEISQCESEIGILATSQVAYYEDLFMRVRAVSENTVLVSGKVPLPQGCEAATKPESLANARDVNRRHTQELVQWREHFEAEVMGAESAVKARVKRLCVLVASVTKATGACTDAVHFEDYLRCPATPAAAGEAGAATASHPLRVCLGVKDGEEDAIPAVDRDGP